MDEHRHFKSIDPDGFVVCSKFQPQLIQLASISVIQKASKINEGIFSQNHKHSKPKPERIIGNWIRRMMETGSFNCTMWEKY